VALDGRTVTDFATDKIRALLFYLAVEAGTSHRREALTGLLWPDQPEERARQNLRQALSSLRQSLGDQGGTAPFLQVTREAIQFDVASDHWLDVAAFSALVESSHAHRHRRLRACRPCLDRLCQAVELYRGDFLAGFFLPDCDPFEEWALLKREWLHREAVEALATLADYHERRGEYDGARAYAYRQVQLEPWREEAHRQLMRLLALSGQRSAALAQYAACRRVLADELGVEPTVETTALFERIRAGEAIAPVAPRIRLSVASASFVGRQAELSELADWLANPDCRLVTLAGPGGIGKTRLALQSAAEQVGAFADGVFAASLAPLSAAEAVVPAIADAVGLSFHGPEEPRRQLLSYLRQKELLLVLDSMEHILEAAGLLAEILKLAPAVVLLVTSRERLNLQEEWVYEVEGLEENSAVELFRQRARQSNRRFALSAEVLPAVGRICRLVEGVPLAVELAAAWVQVRPGDEIANEIARNLDVLATSFSNVPERHRSMRATFEYSWSLLSPLEREVFCRLAVFRGGFEQEAARQVAGASPAMLYSLVRKSLLRRDAAGRFDLHMLLQQYAAEKLAQDPQQREELLLRHARYYAAFLEQHTGRLYGAEWKAALAEVSREVENAGQSWQLALARDAADAVARSLPALYYFYETQSRFREGVALFAQAIERWTGDRRQEAVLGQATARQGALHYRLGDYSQARTALQNSLAIFERLEMPAEQVFCLVKLGDVARGQGRHDEAESLAQRALVLSRQAGDTWGTVSALFVLGVVRYRAGDVDRAEALLNESLAVARASSNAYLIMPPLNALGDIACYRGDYARGQAFFAECLNLSREMGHLYNVAMHLNNLGSVLHALARYTEARAMYQESLEICRQIGDPAGQAVALSNLGEVAAVFGDLARARQYYQQGLTIARTIQDQWTTLVCLNNLGETACALGEYPAAQSFLIEATRRAWETHTTTILMKALVNLAVLLGRQGQKERAAELLGLAFQHPASEQYLREKAARLAAEMELSLPKQPPRPLDVVVNEVLATPARS
jgi:predicted ATPase/DNA-binding SARP family transcriptional activator